MKSSGNQKLRKERLGQVLQFIKKNPDMNIAQIAAKLSASSGVTHRTLSGYIDDLIAAGNVIIDDKTFGFKFKKDLESE